MADYISRQAAIDALGEAPEVWTGSNIETSTLFQWELDRAAIDAVPNADVVSRGCFDSILWENDIMRKQLAEVGKTMGAKMDDVRPVRSGKWIPVTNGRGGSECNLCHAYAPSFQSGAEYKSPFCPNCGNYNGGEAT